MAFILQAQGAWVDALNAQRFSMDEYQWIRGRVWAASGKNVSQLNTGDLAAALKGNGAARPIAEAVGPVPAHNREIVAPYQAKAQGTWAPLALFGL